MAMKYITGNPKYFILYIWFENTSKPDERGKIYAYYTIEIRVSIIGAVENLIAAVNN